MSESFREKYGKKILFWIAVGLVALGIAQPNVGSGVTEKKTDLIRAVSNDEYHQNVGLRGRSRSPVAPYTFVIVRMFIRPIVRTLRRFH